MKKVNVKNIYFIKIFLILFFSLLFVEVVFRCISCDDFFGLELIRIILFSATNSLVIALICSFFKPLICKIIILLYMFLVSIYSIAQLTFYNMLGNYMSFNMASNNGLSRVINQIKNFISSIELNYLIIFIPFVVILIVFIFFKQVLKREKHTVMSIIIIIVFILFVHIYSLFTLSMDIFVNKYQIKSNKELYDTPNLIQLSLKQFGVTRFLQRDLVATVLPSNNEENDDLVYLYNYFLSQDSAEPNEMTGIFKDKNLIFIMVEAFDMIGIQEEITPTLYSLASNGWYFNNYYATPYKCTTGDSEFMATNSMLPTMNGCTLNLYAKNDFSKSIFNLFNNSNYYTSSYHSWTDQYYDRTIFHESMGSSLYLDLDKLGIELVLESEFPSDIDLFEKSVEHYIDKDKFFTFTITASTHFPYSSNNYIINNHWDSVKDLPYSDDVKRYIAKVKELDVALELLINKLKEKNKLDDTVIILFGDHHPQGIDYDEINEASNINRLEDYRMDNVPLIIYNSEIESKVFSDTISGIDLLPTIANLFDLDYDSRFYIGKDIFSEEENVVVFNNGSWITNKALYDATTGDIKAFDTEIDLNSYVIKTNEKVNEYIKVSNKVLEYDFFSD